MSISHGGTNHHTPEIKDKIREKHFSKRIIKICPTCNKEFKIKPSQNIRRRYCSKICQYQSPLFKKMMAEVPKADMKLNKNPNWRGGIQYEPYSIDWTETLKRSIRERDNYICQICNQYGNVAHHIDYNKKNCNPNNLITLCVGCNFKVNYNRNYWIEYFAK